MWTMQLLGGLVARRNDRAITSFRTQKAAANCLSRTSRRSRFEAREKIHQKAHETMRVSFHEPYFECGIN